MADFQGISTTTLYSRDNINNAGPFYHGGYAYFAYLQLSPTVAMRTTKTPDGDTIILGTAADAITGRNQSDYDVVEVFDGPNHYLYAVVRINRFIDLAFTNSFYTFRFDFSTELWTQLADAPQFIAAIDGAPVVTTASIEYDYGLSSPFESANLQLQQGFILTVNPATAEPCLVYTVAGVDVDCGYTPLTIGYSIFSSGAWGAFNPIANSPAAGMIAPQQAFFVAGRLYVIVGALGNDGGGITPCASGLDKTVTSYLIDQDGSIVSSSGLDPFRFNNSVSPPCPPFDQPNYAKSENISGLGFLVTPFAFNGAFGALSRPITVGGVVYWLGLSRAFTIEVYSFDGVTVSYRDSGLTVAMSDIGLGTLNTHYGSNFQIFNSGSQLYIMWRGDVTYGTVANYLSNSSCASTSSWTRASDKARTDYYWAPLTGLVPGTPQRMAVRNVSADANGGTTFPPGNFRALLPIIVPSAGRTYVAGQFTFAVQSGTGWFIPENVSFPAPPITLPCPTSDTAFMGVAFASQLAATGGLAPFTYALLSGPSWLSLTSAGMLSGTPTAIGTFSYSVRVTDANGSTYDATCTIAVGDCQAVPFIIHKFRFRQRVVGEYIDGTIGEYYESPEFSVAPGRVGELKDFLLDYDVSADGGRLEIYSDLPGTAITLRRTLAIPFQSRGVYVFPLEDPSDITSDFLPTGQMFKVRLYPPPGGILRLHGRAVFRARMIGTYFNGANGEVWQTQPLDLVGGMGLYRELAITAQTGGPMTFDVYTELPASDMRLMASFTVAPSATTAGRVPLYFRLPGETKGRLIRFLMRGGYITRLFEAKILARRLEVNGGGWDWVSLPVEPTPEAFSPIQMPVRDTPEAFTWVDVDVDRIE